MAFTITLHPGVVFDANTYVTVAILNQLLSAGYGTVDSGTVDTANITDLAVTAGKLAATLDLSGKTITLPTALKPKSGITAASTVPDFIGQIGLTAANVAYVAYGTSAGNWYRIDINDAVTSIAAAPSRLGQFAFAGGVLYLAQGTSATSDWIAVNPQVYTMADQTSDPAAPSAGTIKLYNKADSFYVRTPAGVVNISGAAFTAVQSAITPNFDSGWTLVEAASRYQLENTAFGRIGGGGDVGAGGFSRTNADKDNSADGYGTTKCETSDFNTLFAPGVNFTGYRFLRILIKKVTAGGTTYASYIVQGDTASYIGGYGLQIAYDSSLSAMVLTVGTNGAFSSITTTNIGDWATYYLASALVRIQAWL